ncbi:MAG: hypothetical protein HeimC3_26020 [Candidatus Heimdallarchaeota archaeon LC_3]|nr:MAG: hypothetical protein HeimC3_26020 [Candidatus Heimdallarchaeota archaeon LC_3]
MELSYFDINLILETEQVNDEKIETFSQKSMMNFEKSLCEIQFTKLEIPETKIKL